MSFGGASMIPSKLFTVNIGVPSPVPEPSTWAMMLLGFAGLGYAGYLRSQRPVSISQTDV
jgi:PEP-CTERM motif